MTQFLLAFLQEQVSVYESFPQPLRARNILTIVGVETEENVALKVKLIKLARNVGNKQAKAFKHI